MECSIKTDRRYTLGEFKYTTMEDIISGIPQDLCFNSEFLSSVRFLQLLSFEIAYRKYIELVARFPHSSNLEDAIKALEELRESELKSLRILLNGHLSDTQKIEE